MTEQEQGPDLFTAEDVREDKLSTGLQIVSFCFPLIGGIIYLWHKDKSPIKAKAACTAALWGFGLGILLNIIATMMRGGV